MQIVRTIPETREAINGLKREGILGCVPTMGYLHDGHLSLMRASVSECARTSVTIFVNPTQFSEGEDFEVYPRDEPGDLRKCDDAGADIVFIPETEAMYRRDSSVYVDEDVLSKYLCGRERPAHFRGVLTVVAKLFNIIQPDVAYFGSKDYQQGVLIKRMVRDLDFPLEIKLLPIIREADGLAMSSRNAYLSSDERSQAVVLNESLELARRMYNAGERSAKKIREAVVSHIGKAPLAQIGYVELRDADNLEPVKMIDRPTLLAMAVRFGKTRLIDNTVLADGAEEA